MRKNIDKKGSAIITAVGLGVILLIIIAAVFTFSRYRTQTVINESKKVKALALAEAGLEVALGELFNNSSFQTHEVEKPASEEEDPKWKENGSQINRECVLQPNNENQHNFQIDSSTSGTISGTLGDGKFKVRVGNIPYEDNPNTKAIDESKAYLLIEAMGMFDKTVRRIVAVVNRRYPCREFLMYDGGVLSVVYGQSNDSDSNVFSIGHLYGDQGIEISNILNSGHSRLSQEGTKQELENLDAITSGNGGIFFYSPIQAKFMNKNGNGGWEGKINSNYTYPTSATYPQGREDHGEMPKEMEGVTPPIAQEVSNWVKDKNSGIRIPPKAPSFAQYKKEAQNGGKYFSSGNTEYSVTKGFSDNGKVKAVYLDFGSGGSKIREANDDAKNFPNNGIFYSDSDIVIKGNPPKDVSIISEKNIFVAGDFNHNGGGKENNAPDEEKYGFPQYYKSKDAGKKGNALSPFSQKYEEETEKLYELDKEENRPYRYHVAATVIAKERVVFDHRSPVDCFENELVPYLKYELAKAINTDSSKNIEQTLKPNEWKSLSIKASDTYDGFKESIASFTKKFKINSDQLAEKLKSNYQEGGEISSDNLDKMTLDAWKAYVEDFNGSTKGDLSQSAGSLEQGVYQLLFRLRGRMCGQSDMGDNPVTSLAEPETYANLDQDEKDFLFYPEMTTNGMFVSCGKLNNSFYAGPDLLKYFDEIGYNPNDESLAKHWYHKPTGFLHRVFGSETNLRLYDVRDSSQNKYRPPLRRKIYDETLPWLGNYGNLELTGFIVLSWQDLTATEDEFNDF